MVVYLYLQLDFSWLTHLIERKVRTQIIIIALLASCSLLRTNISSIRSADNLFLCFPDTDLEYSSLELNEKLSVQKQIFKEKQRRQLQCDNYETSAGAEKS